MGTSICLYRKYDNIHITFLSLKIYEINEVWLCLTTHTYGEK